MKKIGFLSVIKICAALSVFLLFSSHSCNSKNPPSCQNNCLSTGPVIIYKTKKDYSGNVSVKLSDDKSKIVAYPGANDVLKQKPIALHNGYFLKKMVGDAFLSISIEDYAKGNYDKSKELSEYVIDKNPFTEIYECCKCVNRNVDSLNAFLKNGNLPYCQKIK